LKERLLREANLDLNRAVEIAQQTESSKRQAKEISNTSSEESPDLMVTPLQIEGIKKPSAWFADLSTNGGKLTCKLDTGAEVSVLLLHTYNKLDSKPILNQPV